MAKQPSRRGGLALDGWLYALRSSKGIQDAGSDSDAENDRRNPSHFDDGRLPWVECHAMRHFGRCRATALIWIVPPLQAEAGQRAKCEPEKSAKTHRIENEW